MTTEYWWRDHVINDLNGHVPGGPTGIPGGAADDADDDNFWRSKITMNLDVQLTDKVSAFIQLENERNAGTTGNVSDTTYQVGFDNAHVEYEQAYVKVSEFFSPQFDLQVGVQDLRYVVHERTGPFMIDLTESESFFHGFGLGGGKVDPAPSAGFNSVGNGPALRTAMEPVGIKGTWRDDPWMLDMFWFTNLEGGSPDRDESIGGLNFRYDFQPRSSFQILVAVVSGGAATDKAGATTLTIDQHDTQVWTFGGGFNYMDLGFKGFELYAEVYYQFGSVGENAGGSQIQARGLGFQAGAAYTFEDSPNQPWFEVNYSFRRGDKDASDDRREDFLSYENQDRFIILESDEVGLDIDSNVMIFSVGGGGQASVLGGTDNLRLFGWLGFARTNVDVPQSNTPAGVVPAGIARQDDLGGEFDLKMEWDYNKALMFDAAFAYMFSNDVAKEFTKDREDSASMYTMGAKLRF